VFFEGLVFFARDGHKALQVLQKMQKKLSWVAKIAIQRAA
jgi:hypothetical protein